MENACNDNGKDLSKIYLDMAEMTTMSLSQNGFSCTSYNIFTHLLLDIAILKIIEYTNQQLVIKGHPITNVIQFKQFLGARWLTSRLRVLPELAINKIQETVKYNAFTLVDRRRYTHIYQSIRNDEITWMKRGVLLQNLAPWRRNCFQN